MQSTCSVDGCERVHRGRGFCRLHYGRWRQGDPSLTPEPPKYGRPIIERVEAKVRKGPGCWLWTGVISSTTGYGHFTEWDSLTRTAHTRLVHRFVYEHYMGPIPKGLTLDHQCRNRACVNPAHLQPMGMRENILLGSGPSAANARKTHCKRGHEFTPENTYHQPGRQNRTCRACDRARVLRNWRRKRDLLRSGGRF